MDTATVVVVKGGSEAYLVSQTTALEASGCERVFGQGCRQQVLRDGTYVDPFGQSDIANLFLAIHPRYSERDLFAPIASNSAIQRRRPQIPRFKDTHLPA